jgi:hypothetical protein
MHLGRALRQIGVPCTAELLAEIGAQFRAARPSMGTPAWEEQEQEVDSLMAGWMHLLEGWPAAEVLSRIGDEVCQMLPKAVQEGSKLLARGEASEAVLASLRALTVGDGRTRLWALLALGRLTRISLAYLPVRGNPASHRSEARRLPRGRCKLMCRAST